MAEERKFIARMQILGGDQVKRESDAAARSVESSAQRMQTAWQRIGVQAEGLDSGFKRLNRGVSDARGSIELLGTAIPGLDSAFGTISRTIGNVADVFGTLSALLLRNPIGLAATGVASAAAAFLIFRKNSDDVRTSQEQLAKALEATNALLATQSQRAEIALEASRRVALKQAEDALPGLEAAARAAQENLKRLEAVTERQQRAQRENAGRQFDRDDVSASARAAAEIAQRRVDDARGTVLRLQSQARILQDPAAFAQRELLFPGRGPTQFRVGGSREDLSEEDAVAQLRRDAAAQARIQQEAAERADAAQRRSAAAAAEEQRAIDALIARFAPATKAQQELTAARADAIRLMREGKITNAEFEEVLRGIADAEQKGTASAQERAQIQQFAARTIEEVKSAEERYAEAIAATDAALKANLITTEQAARKREIEVKRLQDATSDAGDEARRNKEIARDLGLTFQSAFEDAIVRGKKFSDVLKGITEDIARMIIRFTITIPLARALSDTLNSIGGGPGGIGGIFGGVGQSIGNQLGYLFNPGRVLPGDPTGGLGPAFLANGGVFSGGAQIVPFAAGGSVVNRPTVFPIAGGRIGLMGEAGPEAIMPLERGRDGKLGVRGGGGASVVQITNSIDARGADKSLRDALPGLLRQNSEQTIARIEQLLDRGGSLSRKSGRRIT